MKDLSKTMEDKGEKEAAKLKSFTFARNDSINTTKIVIIS